MKLPLALLTQLLTPLAALHAAEPSGTKPNILYILADDLEHKNAAYRHAMEKGLWRFSYAASNPGGPEGKGDPKQGGRRP